MFVTLLFPWWDTIVFVNIINSNVCQFNSNNVPKCLNLHKS